VARRGSHVRAVLPDERKPKVLTLAEAIAGGIYLQMLLAQRRDIVASLPEEKGQAKATLHRQLRDISKEIESLELAAVDGAGSVVAKTDDDAWDDSAI
jgi:hypothetical protein